MNELEMNELNNMPNEAEKEVFVIKDLSGLNWAFKKMRALKKKVNEVNEIADNDIKMINEWRDKELEKYESDLSYFDYKISEYHENELALDPKRKSISTPYGKVVSRRTQAQPEKTSTNELLNYVKEVNTSLIKVETKETLMWSELKSKLSIVEHDGQLVVVDEYGTLVPGVAVKPEQIKITVEVNE